TETRDSIDYTVYRICFAIASIAFCICFTIASIAFCDSKRKKFKDSSSVTIEEKVSMALHNFFR
ncbi:hypothetical protein ACJX0J_016027, partial [Zea mays]